MTVTSRASDSAAFGRLTRGASFASSRDPLIGWSPSSCSPSSSRTCFVTMSGRWSKGPPRVALEGRSKDARVPTRPRPHRGARRGGSGPRGACCVRHVSHPGDTWRPPRVVTRLCRRCRRRLRRRPRRRPRPRFIREALHPRRLERHPRRKRLPRRRRRRRRRRRLSLLQNRVVNRISSRPPREKGRNRPARKRRRSSPPPSSRKARTRAPRRP